MFCQDQLPNGTRFLILLSVALFISHTNVPLACAQPVEAASQVDFEQEEFPPLPTPSWVRMIDQGETNPRLTGLKTPDGIRIDIVASEPAVIDPVGMTFANDGTPYVLEWKEATQQVDITYDVHYQDGTTASVNRKTKNALDQLKRLTDTNGDGIYDSAKVIMDDLEYPSTVLLHDNWMYFPSVGHVIRRKAMANGEFEEQEILRGMCGYHHHQVSGLTISHDNWLYTTTGDDDNIAEGSDGSRSTVLRTGAIFRSRPDGSQLTEFARGFRNPYRSVVFDETFNMFHVDNDQEDGSKFQGVRLMHLLEGADYGWRLMMGAKCCRTDFARGAVFGERPGKMPSMLKTGRGAPAGLLLYQQEQFPEFFRGLLIYPDCYRMKVRAYAIERTGSTFAVTQQFTLMEADDGMFRPVQALAGPDGAIYILDWRTDSGGAGKSWGDSQHGRIYRLSWSGTAEYPAIPLKSMDSWNQLASKSPDALFNVIKTSGDAELRIRAQMHLLQRGNSFAEDWLALANDVSASVTARALAIGAASTFFDDQTQAAMTQLLASDNNADVRRLAAEALNRHGALDQETVDVLLNSARSDAHPAVRRAAALAAGRMAERAIPDVAQGELIRTVPTHLLTTLAATDREDVYLFDGILRAIEYCGAAGMDPLVAAIQSGDQQQIEFSIGLFEALRTRPAADALDRILADHADALTVAQLQRILETYRHILLHPAVDSAGILAWLQHHPDSADSLQVTALQTLGMLGGGQAAGVADLALRLLQSDDGDIQLDTIHAIGELRIMAAVRPLVTVIADGKRSNKVRLAAVQSLGMLRAEAWPFLDRQDQGVELVVDDLVRLCQTTTGSLQADILSLVSQVKIESAVPLAQQLLQSDDVQTVAAAIDVLGTRRDQAVLVAQRYLAGEIDSQQLARVASGLQRHVPNDANGEISQLIAQLYQDGLKISNEPSEVERIKDLVRRTGNADRGKLVFLAKEKSQCAKCHQLEGVGGQIGPDLSGIWQTHTVEKLIESVAVPSKEIKEGFATWNAVTGSGQVYSGLKLSEDNREVVLRDANGRDIRINKNEIEELNPSQTSLMPDGTVAQLTLTEFIDLLAFLKDGRSQKSLANEAQN